MLYRPNKNIKIFFNYVLGPLLGIWLFYSLYKQVKDQPDLQLSLDLVKKAPFGDEAWKFWTVIILVFVNWGIEARKWQLLMEHVERLSFIKAFKGVLSGLTLSLNTPNRIGEYGGRILYVKDGNRLKAISLSIAGSISQIIITLFMGCGGLAYLIYFMRPESAIMGLSVFWLRTMLILSCIALLVMLLLFFKLSWLVKLVERIPGISKFVQYIAVLDEFTPSILFRLLSLSATRYLVFVFQYILMMQVLNVEMSVLEGFWVVTVLFLVLAIVPSFAIADLGIRGKFSVELFTLYSANTIGIIGTTFGIWFLNLFVPAIAGSLLILSTRIFRAQKA